MNRLLILAFVFGCASALPAADNSCNCVCGVRGRGNRIVGGHETSANEYPWMVGLYRNGRIYCGGALISTKHILTAAHCVHSFDRKDIKIYIGGHNISTDYVDTRRVGRIYEHEYFDTVTFDFDIAILEMSKPVQFGPKVQPACLPQTQFEDYSGKSAMIAGWGRLGEQGQTSDRLRQVVVPIWSAEECAESDYGKKRLTGNMMCAGFKEGGKDACQGDSGGPMHYEGETGSMEVIGVVSWGRGCARPKLPGIYTRVANFLPWIEKQLGSTCMCSPKKGIRTGIFESEEDDNIVQDDEDTNEYGEEESEGDETDEEEDATFRAK